MQVGPSVASRRSTCIYLRAKLLGPLFNIQLIDYGLPLFRKIRRDQRTRNKVFRFVIIARCFNCFQTKPATIFSDHPRFTLVNINFRLWFPIFIPSIQLFRCLFRFRFGNVVNYCAIRIGHWWKWSIILRLWRGNEGPMATANSVFSKFLKCRVKHFQTVPENWPEYVRTPKRGIKAEVPRSGKLRLVPCSRSHKLEFN